MFQLIAETTDCDFKEVVEHAKPKSWLKSVSAFANNKGGTLVFGVSDKDHAVVGLQDAQAEADFISQAIRSRIDPVPPFEMNIESEGAADVIVLDVPEGGDTPYYYRADGRMEAFVRIGNRSEVASATQLRDLALKGTNQTWDALDSNIPVNRASFTVLRAAFANRAGIDLDPADLVSFDWRRTLARLPMRARFWQMRRLCGIPGCSALAGPAAQARISRTPTSMRAACFTCCERPRLS